MKKLSVVALALVASLSFTSCNSPESLVKQYEKACKAGNEEKAEKILEKMNKYDEDDFTADQMSRIFEATVQLSVSSFGDAMQDAADEIDDYLGAEE